MTLQVIVYGFGSYFCRLPEYADIDLLLVHKTTERVSCDFALNCKAALKFVLPTAHITILSSKEAATSPIFGTNSKTMIGAINVATYGEDLNNVVSTIRKFMC